MSEKENTSVVRDRSDAQYNPPPPRSWPSDIADSDSDLEEVHPSQGGPHQLSSPEAEDVSQSLEECKNKFALLERSQTSELLA